METTKFDTWVIDTGGDGRTSASGLIGRYWYFSSEDSHILPTHMAGCHFAMFQTKEIAKRHLPETRDMFPKSKVVHVTVTIKKV